MDLADARSNILLRTHRNLMENSPEPASGLGRKVALSRTSPGALRCWWLGRADLGGAGAGGSRSGAGRQGNRASCKQPHRRDNVRRRRTPGNRVGRGPGRPRGPVPAAATSCVSPRDAGAQRHGPDGTVRARSPQLPLPACPRGACAAARLPRAPGGLESRPGFSFRAWERLKTLPGERRTRGAGF